MKFTQSKCISWAWNVEFLIPWYHLDQPREILGLRCVQSSRILFLLNDGMRVILQNSWFELHLSWLVLEWIKICHVTTLVDLQTDRPVFFLNLKNRWRIFQITVISLQTFPNNEWKIIPKEMKSCLLEKIPLEIPIGSQLAQDLPSKE